MLKNIITYLVIIAGVSVLYLSTSKKMMEAIISVRNETDSWWGVHSSDGRGDLVRIGYLDYVKKFNTRRDYEFKKAACNGEPVINLYLHGDSYTFKIPDTAFACVNRYEYAWMRRRHIQYNLDTTKKNILVLEHTERYVAMFYERIELLSLIYDSVDGSAYNKYMPELAKPNVVNAQHKPTWYNHLETLFHRTFRDCFNKLINQNIEYNLFNYKILNAPRAIKALLNYYVFKRASGDVAVSEDGERLYIKQSTISHGVSGAYYPFTDKEYNHIRNNLNILYKHYRSEGFDEVYFAMIPCPISVLEPQGYNQLVPRLQNDPESEMKFIDIYSLFQDKEVAEKVFRPDDTHWNNIGMQMWISVVNDSLSKWYTPSKDSISVVTPAQ